MLIVSDVDMVWIEDLFVVNWLFLGENKVDMDVLDDLIYEV